MTDTYWHKQTKDQPLFPDLLWSRPENKAHAGKLLIIGGNSFGFAAPAEAFMAATKAGAGSVRVVLPLKVKKVTDNLMPSLEYAASTPSGSFGKQALGDFLEHASWADGALFAGDLGRNSETAILMESFLAKHAGQVTLANDAVDYCLTNASPALKRPETLVVCTMSQLQKLGVLAHSETAFTHNMDLLRLVDGLHALTKRFTAKIIIGHLDHIIVAVDGRVSMTPLTESSGWATVAAADAAVWWLQNPAKTFESLTTSVIHV